jgi:hypothetical protein
MRRRKFLKTKEWPIFRVVLVMATLFSHGAFAGGFDLGSIIKTLQALNSSSGYNRAVERRCDGPQSDIKAVEVLAGPQVPSSSVQGDPRLNSIKALLFKGDDGRDSICTGTFLNDYVMVTAAHCLAQRFIAGEGNIVAIPSDLDSSKARYQAGERFPASTKAVYVDRGQDIAFIAFPRNSYHGPTFRLKLARSPGENVLDGVTAYGRGGEHGPNGVGDAKLRSNTGKVEFDDGMVNSGLKSGILIGRLGVELGDSGGPLIKNGEIIGIDSKNWDEGPYSGMSGESLLFSDLDTARKILAQHGVKLE